MNWMLIVVLAWASAPPLTVLEIRVASKALCEAAGEQMKEDLSSYAAGEAVKTLVSVGPGVLTTCVKVAP